MASYKWGYKSPNVAYKYSLCIRTSARTVLDLDVSHRQLLEFIGCELRKPEQTVLSLPSPPWVLDLLEVVVARSSEAVLGSSATMKLVLDFTGAPQDLQRLQPPPASLLAESSTTVI